MFYQVFLEEIIVQPQWCKSQLARICFARAATREKTVFIPPSTLMQLSFGSDTFTDLQCTAGISLEFGHVTLQTMKDLLQPKSFFISRVT